MTWKNEAFRALPLRERIDSCMDSIQQQLEANMHLSNEETSERLQWCSGMWSALSEEDRDYVQAGMRACEDKRSWGDPTK
jgi:hypothetical protein